MYCKIELCICGIDVCICGIEPCINVWYRATYMYCSIRAMYMW